MAVAMAMGLRFVVALRTGVTVMEAEPQLTVTRNTVYDSCFKRCALYLLICLHETVSVESKSELI